MRQGMKSARDGRFGMKAQVGTDPKRLVHTLATTHAGASEYKQLPKLLNSDEREFYADQAYWTEMHRLATKEPGVRCRLNRRANLGRCLTEYWHRLNRLRWATRTRGEHAFLVVKRLLG